MEKSEKILVLGGRGNAGLATILQLLTQGHHVTSVAFEAHVPISGTPDRPPSTFPRKFVVSNIPTSTEKFEQVQLSDLKHRNFSVVINAFPSYMIPSVAEILLDNFETKKLSQMTLINLSDRFLGTYDLLRQLGAKEKIPLCTIAFNGVPFMAQKSGHSFNMFYNKPVHSIAYYPSSLSQHFVSGILFSLFGILELKIFPSLFHLGFQNTHCLEHVIVDLINLKLGHYAKLNQLQYSAPLYTSEMTNLISMMCHERDDIYDKIFDDNRFRPPTLAQYDATVFKDGAPWNRQPGTPEYRIEHKFLNKAPCVTVYTASGYEDVLCCLCLLEEWGVWTSIPTPMISQCLNKWSDFMKVDYRKFGRSLQSLDLIGTTKNQKNYHKLNWKLPFIFPTNISTLFCSSQYCFYFLEPFSQTDIIERRNFQPTDLISSNVLSEIFNEFREEVPLFFGSNLLFGFITGGAGGSYLSTDGDIDIFICLREWNLKQVLTFRLWYFLFHRKFALKPDLEAPGSLTTWDHLLEKVTFAGSIRIRPTIRTSYEKQCIVWTDMITGPKQAFIGDYEAYRRIQQLVETLPQKWRKEIIAMMIKKEMPNFVEEAKLPLTRLFRKYVTYLKEGDPKLSEFGVRPHL